jgi:uncharacterized protein DUF3536/glycosyl hydrolase family 57
MTGGTLPRRSIVIHAHFYQPPREEPWLELVEREPGAAPYHDWNQKIEQECYRSVVAARIPGSEGRIARIVNTLEAISFNVGPTLIEWLEREAPNTWAAMLAADRQSRARRGQGNAIAMPYHHLILPLASRRDKLTEVRWGIADFRRRFGREPVGMWLPETAVDEETLDVLASEGIRFTIVAPHQVVEAPPAGLPGKYVTTSGRTLALFVYDGPLSHDVAFGPLITDSDRWSAELLGRPLAQSGPTLISLATDGETYGHHHRFGEMALAATLERVGRDPDTRLENYASFLARHPAEHPVELVAPSSWSCVHGVERWRADCGCRTRPGTNQAWRAPLREALDWLAGELHARFESEAEPLLKDPWAARDAYAAIGLPSHLPGRGRELLEMERNALAMFGSCGWFFDDIAGLETIGCLRYAARAIEWAGAGAEALAEELRSRLAPALSNDPAKGTGREVYDRALPAHPPEARAAAAYAALRLLAPERLKPVVGAYLIEPGSEERLRVQHRRTGRIRCLAARAERPSPVGLLVSVTESRDEVPATTHSLALPDLPEPEREALHHAFRRELRASVLTREEETRIVDGLVTYRAALAEALIRQLPADPTAAHEVDRERLSLTLDLLALEERPLPFDAQTRYYRLLTQGPPEARRALRGFAERFGFALSRDRDTAAPGR